VSQLIPVAGGHVWPLLHQELYEPVQRCHDVRGVDHGPLGEIVGADYTLLIRKRPEPLFFLRHMDIFRNWTLLSFLYLFLGFLLGLRLAQGHHLFVHGDNSVLDT
jgi:hypothetical protein